MEYVKISKKAFTGTKKLCSSVYSRQDALFDLVAIMAFHPDIKGITYEGPLTISYESTNPLWKRWGWNHMRVGSFLSKLEEMGYIKREIVGFTEPKKITWVSNEIVLTDGE